MYLFLTPYVLKMASKLTAETIPSGVTPGPSRWAQVVMSCVFNTVFATLVALCSVQCNAVGWGNLFLVIMSGKPTAELFFIVLHSTVLGRGKKNCKSSTFSG